MAFSFNHNGALWIVLDEENISRMQGFDPFEFNGESMPIPMVLTLPVQIVVAYAHRSEYEKLKEFTTSETVVKYLQRGWHVEPSDMERGVPYKVMFQKPSRE